MLIEKFLQYIKYERAYSAHTLLSYETDLNQFKTFVEQQKGRFDPIEITASDIREWIFSLTDEHVASSIDRKLTTLRSFYKYLLREGQITVSPMDKITAPKKQKKLPVFIRENEMDDLLNNLEGVFGDDYEGIRDKFIIEMFYSLGVRISELMNIKDKDIDFDRNTIIITGKRNKQRVIPFGDSLKSIILAFVKRRNEEIPDRTDYLIIRPDGQPLYPMLVYRIVTKYLSLVSTQTKRSPHVLRHTFATAMLNNGADINAVKELLGHANLAATQVYTHTTFERLQKIYKKAHPRA